MRTERGLSTGQPQPPESERRQLPHDFRDLLNDQLKKVNALPAYGPPGGFQSAAQTKSNLEHGCSELKRVINDYTKYLDAFADTVTEAGKRLIQSG